MTSTIEVPFGSAFPVMRIDGRRNIVGAAVMADIGDAAVALMMDGRLIGAARLQIAGSDQLHVGGFGRRADYLLLCKSGPTQRENESETQTASSTRAFMLPPRLFKANLRWLSNTIARRYGCAKHTPLTCNHLVAYYPAMDEVFKALADASRRSLLDRLHARNGQTLNEFCDGLAMTRQAVTKHLGILEEANLVTTFRHGREKLHYLNPVPIHQIGERWIRKFERGKLAALSELKRQLEKRDE